MSNHFDVSREAIVSDAFSYDGRTYKVGDVFPHVALGVIPLSLKGLWMTQRIRFSDQPASRPKAISPKATQPAR